MRRNRRCARENFQSPKNLPDHEQVLSALVPTRISTYSRPFAMQMGRCRICGTVGRDGPLCSRAEGGRKDVRRLLAASPLILLGEQLLNFPSQPLFDFFENQSRLNPVSAAKTLTRRTGGCDGVKPVPLGCLPIEDTLKFSQVAGTRAHEFFF